MKKCFIQHSLTTVTLAALAAAVALLAPAPAQANTSWARGGNWATSGGDPYNMVYPDGITSSTTTTQAAAVAHTIAGDYNSIGLNFVRISVDPATVSGGWAVVQAYVNQLVADGMYVDICCSYIDQSTGVMPNESTWESMWKTVDGVYSGNTNVYYEPINEPWGYSATSLESIYTTFLGFINKSQGHIILGGTRYEDHVTAIGADSSFNNCLLAVHDYPFWEPYTSDSAWSTDLYDRVYPYQGRTIMTEMGAVTTSGLDYLDPSSNSNICFVQGMCNQCVSWGGMGTVWFPTHQAAGNNKEMFTALGGELSDGTLIPELQYGWGWHTVYHDFYGRGYYDYVMYQPSAFNWWIKDSANGGGGTNTFQWGTSGDVPLVGKSAQDTSDAADAIVWRASDTTFYIRNSDGTSFTVALGSSGDVPFVGNFYGSGKSAYCVYEPGTGNWLVRASGTSGTDTFNLGGVAGDVPLVGNCSGDNCADAVIWSTNSITGQGTFTVRRSEDGTTFSANWGQTGDIPMLADFSGDGKDDFVIFRPSNGGWYLMDSQTLESVPGFQWGQNGDIPMCGIMNGDMCAIIYRPSNQTWYVWDPEAGSGISAPHWGNSSVNPVK